MRKTIVEVGEVIAARIGSDAIEPEQVGQKDLPVTGLGRSVGGPDVTVAKRFALARPMVVEESAKTLRLERHQRYACLHL